MKQARDKAARAVVDSVLWEQAPDYSTACEIVAKAIREQQKTALEILLREQKFYRRFAKGESLSLKDGELMIEDLLIECLLDKE